MTKDIITEAFQRAPRVAFLPPEVQEYADEDRPLSIGYGQTNSQPTTVRRMLEWLDVKPGQKILDVGSGSGWTSALLAFLSSPLGFVWAVEKVRDLVGFGRRNCEALEIENVMFVPARRQLGLPTEAPYDRILVSASAPELPDELVNQLGPDGTMVVPVRNDIYIVKKGRDGRVHIDVQSGYIFVPLVDREHAVAHN